MNETLTTILVTIESILSSDVPERNGLPAHVWAYRLRDELELVRKQLMQIRTELREIDDADLFLAPLPEEDRCDCGLPVALCDGVFGHQPDAQCCGCMQHVSHDLIERGLCQRCRS